MGLKMRKFGDWAKAGEALTALGVDLNPELIATLDTFGELFLERVREHIDNQDLGWIPLSKSTVAQKTAHPNDVYIETGSLYNGLEVRKVKSAKNNYTIFVGASPYKVHTPSGETVNKIMIWLEYGTDDGRIPPRPIIQPTWDELEPLIKKELTAVIPSIIRR